jgi:hypothetical protein
VKIVSIIMVVLSIALAIFDFVVAKDIGWGVAMLLCAYINADNLAKVW